MNLESVQILAKWSTYWKMGHIDEQTWKNQRSGPNLCLAKIPLKNMGMLMTNQWMEGIQLMNILNLCEAQGHGNKGSNISKILSNTPQG
jgi:hypothetical protein